MPIILSSLLAGLISIASTLAGRVLLALGFGFVEYAGISTLANTVMTQATAQMGALNEFPLMLAWAGFLRIDVHIGLVISAIGVKMMFNALAGPTVRRIVQK